jgi:Fe-S cluster biogenesis protein NfuA
MALRERAEEVIQRINPKLEDLAAGYIEFMDLDEGKGVLTIKLFGGRLH